MITYAIVVSNSRDKPRNSAKQQEHAIPGTPSYKTILLKRQLNRCRLHGGDAVRMKGSNKRGAVVDVLGNPDDCAWKDNIPYFIRVKWDGDTFTTLCPLKLLKKVN